MCGGESYDLKQQFCYRDSLVDLCGKKSYDLEREFCFNGTVVNLCGGQDYNTRLQFCYNDSLVDRCNGSTYDLETEFCSKTYGTERVLGKCSGEEYDPMVHFCFEDSLVYLCDGREYDLRREFCFTIRDTIVTLCGGRDYDLNEQFCHYGRLLDLCDGKSYDADVFTCYDNEIVPYECNGEEYVFEQKFCYVDIDLDGNIIGEELVDRCGGKTYDLKRQFCFEDRIYELCEKKEFDPNQQFCDDGRVKAWCNDRTYTLDREFCDERNWRVYRYTTINGVTWMADNLDYRVPDSFCDSIHKDHDVFCGVKGRFYVWSAAMAMPESVCGYGHSCENDIQYPHQGVCPEGWHLPTKDEWDELIGFMGRSGRVYLDSSVRLDENTYGTDDYGFSAIPTGFVVTDSSRVGRCTSNVDGSRRYDDYLYCRLSIGTKNSTGFDAWTSTESRDPDRSSSYWVYVCYFYAEGSYGGGISTSTWYKSVSRTVRCVKNEEEQ
jgi:uncharacterized protein (TIGR02145 family)